MSSRIPELYRDAGKAILAKALPKLVGQPSAILSDRKRFDDLLVSPAWAELPLPCRLLGRKRLGWDLLFDQIRVAVYDGSGPTIKMRADAAARVTEAFRATVLEVAARLNVAAPASSIVAGSGSAAGLKAAAGKTSAGKSAGPGSSAKPAGNPDVAIGIDLGTTFSAVAWIDADGRPVAFENSTGDLITPSVVYFEDEGTIVGKEAARVALVEPDRVAECAKRDMGKKHYRKPLNGEMVPPEVISSIILRSLKADAERRLGPVTQAVITVPAYFDEPRRQATINAGKLAGLDVLDIINEPTAAAISYGYQKGFFHRETGAVDKPMKVLVYDLGGGTFDVTILSIEGQNFTVVATDGDVTLGGKDWDQQLVDFAAEKFQAEHGEDPRKTPTSLQDLFAAAEQAKRALTERTRTTMIVTHAGKRSKIDVTRQDFEDATAALLLRTRHTCKEVLRASNLQWSNIDRIVLVGGSTRMPQVAAMLEELSPGSQVDRSLSPDLAVAHGAAIYADVILKRKKAGSSKFKLIDVNSHSLGIVGIEPSTMQKINHVLIPKNTHLPHRVTQGFKLAKAGQKGVRIEVLEGESRQPKSCTAVGTAIVSDLPENLPLGTSIDITYEYEPNGRLHVAAKLRDHNGVFRITFERENSLKEDDFGVWSEYVAHESRRMLE